MASVIKSNKGYKYAKKVVSGELVAPKYVRLQCAEFLCIADGKSEKYIINEDLLYKMTQLLHLFIMPTGAKSGFPMDECLVGFQWLFVIATMCVVHRSDTTRRRYTRAVLSISRKNSKTLLSAVITLLSMLTEPKYARCYSVSADGSLARETQKLMQTIIGSSPALSGKVAGTKQDRFRCMRDEIRSWRETFYYPLNTSNSRLDSRAGTVVIEDEVGAMTSSYPIQAMVSGQILIKNHITIEISTLYPTLNNPFDEEIDYSKKVLDGVVEQDDWFSLLYNPDEEIEKSWQTNDDVIRQSNPLAYEMLLDGDDAVWNEIVSKRNKAVISDGDRENTLTKHLGIKAIGVGTERYVSIDALQACKVDKIDWAGRYVYIGLDTSMTTDNSSVSMVAYDEDTETVLAKSWTFVPSERIQEKTVKEKVDYQAYVRQGYCYACDGAVISYKDIEDHILSLEKEYGVEIAGVYYDRYNTLSTAQKLDEQGIPTCEVKQHSMVLHPAIKFLAEKIESGKFRYEPQPFLEMSFQNARCVYDTSMNRYIHRKKSNGKVDNLFALIDGIHGLQQTEVFGRVLDWSVQTI